MSAVDEILEQVRNLPAEERERFLDALEDLPEADFDEVKRRAALEWFISRAGTGHSRFTDVARDKYKHLAEIYSDKK